MIKSQLHSNLLLLLAAMIWGFAFVAQRIGMNYIGPFTFNGLRFTLGAIVLLPFLAGKYGTRQDTGTSSKSTKQILFGSILTGLLLFGGATFQQIGLQTTTAGKAGFITGLYVVFVPVAGILLKQKTGIFVWAGVILSAWGLYLLSITSEFRMEYGDFMVLIASILFTGHVLIIGWLSPKMNSFRLAIIQFSICGGLSLLTAFIFEEPHLSQIIEAGLPVLYGGLFSVGIAFTLQVVAQKEAAPTAVAIILSLEAVFAAIGGWMILHEYLSFRSIIGCLMMLGGMIVVQARAQTNKPS